MQHQMEDFIRALRASDVKVSPAESIDAHEAVARIGYVDRELLKDALCATLAKSEDEVARFDRAFDNFFARDPFDFATPPPPPEGGEAAPPEAKLEDVSEEGGWLGTGPDHSGRRLHRAQPGHGARRPGRPGL